MSETIKVLSLDGLYDEKSLAELHDINKRTRWCFTHKWINASLRWRA